jgi:RNA polymerase sigma-70 factor (ECF subfamily)
MSTLKPEFNKENLGDIRNFEAFYDYYAPMLWRHILIRTRSVEDTDDILSKAFLKTWEYIKGEKKIKNPHAFLWAVANRLIVDFYRSKARVKVKFVDFQTLINTKSEPIVPSSIEEKISIKDDIIQIANALEQLKYEERLLLTLRFVEELSLEEVAAVYGKSKNATAVAIHRALTKLRKILNGNNNLSN